MQEMPKLAPGALLALVGTKARALRLWWFDGEKQNQLVDTTSVIALFAVGAGPVIVFFCFFFGASP